MANITGVVARKHGLGSGRGAGRFYFPGYQRAALAAAVVLSCGPLGRLAPAAVQFFDISSTSGLTPGTANWDAGTTAAWANSASPGVAAPVVWVQGGDATFSTAGVNTANVTGATPVLVGNITITASGNSQGTTIGAGAVTPVLMLGGNITTSGGNANNTFSVTMLNLAGTTHSVSATANTNVFSANIGETAAGNSLIFTGAGSATLSGVNTFSGGVTIGGAGNTGTLNIGSTTALGAASGTFTINQGGVFNASAVLVMANNNGQQWNGDFTFTGTNNLTFGGAVTLGGNVQVTVGGTTNVLTETGIIGDGGSGFSLTKAGTGLMTITSANTAGNSGYSGATTVSGGALTLGGAAGAITSSAGIVLNGGRLLLDNSTSNNNDRIGGNVTLSLGGELNLTGAGTAGSTTEVIGNLGLDTGNSIITVTGSGAGQVQTLSVGTFTRSNRATGLVRGTALGNGAAATTRVTFGDTTNLTEVGTVTANTGAAGSVTNLHIVPFLFGDSSPTGLGAQSTGDFLTYDTGSGSLRVLGANEQLALVALAATNNTAIAGASDLNVIVKSGVIANLTGTRIFNSLSLATNTTSGTPTSLTGDGSALTLSSGALLDGGASSATNTLSGFSTITLGNGEGVIYKNAGSLFINSAIDVTSSGGLTKGGSGNLILGAANVYTGNTVVNQGTLTIGNGTAGNLDPTGTVIINPQGALALNMADGGVLANTIVNNGAAILKPAGVTVNTLSGGISGTGGVTVNNTVAGDVLSLSGTVKTYTGSTLLNNGILRVVGDVLSTSSAVAFTSAGVTTPTLQLRGDSNTLFHNGGFSFSAATSQPRVATIDVGPATPGVTGKTLTMAGTFTVTNPGSGLNTANLFVTGAGDGYTLGLENIALSTSSGLGLLQVNVSGAALSLGGVTLGSGGLIFVGSGNSAITGDMIRNTISNSLTLTQSGSGALTLTGSAVTTSSTSGAGYIYNLSAGTLNVNAAGALGSSAVGTYSRTLNISGGTLDNSSGGAVTAVGNPAVNINNDFAFGGTRALDLGAGATVLGAVGSPATARVITTNGTTEALTLEGVITAGTATSLTKAGTGTLAIAGNSPLFVLPVLVTGGNLVVGVGGVGSVGSAITVNAGTLSGSGSTSGAVTVGDGTGSADAVISPGNSPGMLTTGALTFASDGVYKYELNTTATAAGDKIVATGVTIDPNAFFSFNAAGDESGLSNNVLLVIDNTGGSGISGTFGNLADNSSFTAGNFTYTANYEGGTGNDLTLTVSPAAGVPEPASLALLGLGAAVLLRRRRGC